MSHRSRSRIIIYLLLIGLALTVTSGCGVYFNTFFNARKAFNKAEKARKDSKSNRKGAGGKEYLTAIEKCQKVVDNHPNSKYYDDAVYILGVSYFYTEQYGRADRRFRELLADFPDSKFARDAHLYLAKTKLALGEIEEARAIFEDIFSSTLPREFKVEAAWALGRFYYDEHDYERAAGFFRAIRDSLGRDNDMLEAQMDIGDAYFDAFKFEDALGAYLQVQGLKPDKDQKYHSTYRAALCAFNLMRIKTGMAYLQELIDNADYYDSLGSLKLAVARGYERDDDLLAAEDVYDNIIDASESGRAAATASFRLGLIYQVEYNDLVRAKEYYDKSAETANSPVKAAAIQRSADIGKLQQYSHKVLDTAATQAAIDDAAFTQFQFAELYWVNLDQPDSAIKEMEYLVDSMPKSYYTPKAMISLAEMIRSRRADTSAADSILRATVMRFPHSDFVPDALGPLGLLGTPADTGYPKLYYNRAEDFLVLDEQIDSARYWYQYVVDKFPESEYYIPARFNLIWLTENYQSPGDSSVIFAYREFADSFPNDPLAVTAMTRSGDTEAARNLQDNIARPRADDVLHPEVAAAEEGEGDTEEGADTGSTYIDPKEALYKGPDGEKLVDLRLEPIETLEEFEFPDEAAAIKDYEWHLYYQVLIDFSGRVIDYVLKIPSGIQSIDQRASETVGSMTFDAAAVSNRAVSAGLTDQPEGDGRWFVYEYVVEKPDYLR